VSSRTGKPSKKLATIALIAATITMQLVLAWKAGSQGPLANRVFDDEQIRVLHALQQTVQARTKKQQNPFEPQSLAWARLRGSAAGPDTKATNR
jgi:hypothetical protein